MADLIGQVFNSFHLVEKLGQGGMAEVYKAYQPSLDRYVALKLLLPDIAKQPDFWARFEQEAKFIARLSHPNIVHVYDFGKEGDRGYLAMEYVSEGTLKKWLADRGVVSPSEALMIFQQLAAALDYAHEQGIIHRDIKPANIMLTAGSRVLLTDFGIARLLHTDGELTQTGATTGTPVYMSPEQIRGDLMQQGPASDIYSLGVVLFEMLTGRPPFQADNAVGIIFQHLNEMPPSLHALNADLPDAVDEVIQKALAKDPLDRYLRAGEFLLAFQEAIGITAQAIPAYLWQTRTIDTDDTPVSGESPYKGLQYFEECDSSLFCGRESLIARLVARLRENLSIQGAAHFLAIIGASGSGKSSVVRAGLIPVLRRGIPLEDGTLPPDGSVNWPMHVLTPTNHPLESLAICLTSDAKSVITTATLMDDLASDPRSLRLYLRKYQQSPMLLVVDQFEELFTLCRDEAERKLFVDNLVTASEAKGQAVVIIVMRADFYHHCARYDELRHLLAHQQEYLGQMNAQELRRAIESPAKSGGWELEPGLVEMLLQDIGAEPGVLPLLSHAMLETWQRRKGHALTLQGYTRSGGVRGAIARTAESIYKQFSLEEQAIARNIFLRLTEPGDVTEDNPVPLDTRRRATLDELIPAPERQVTAMAVLQRLVAARLVTAGKDTIEVAHEALIREWPTLRAWLEEDRQGLRLHRRLTDAAQEWQREGRQTSDLYRGVRLSQALEWAAGQAGLLNSLEREFLESSRQWFEQEQTEREAGRQRELEQARKLTLTQRQRSWVLAVGLIIALLMTFVTLAYNRQASQSLNVARIANTQSAANASTAVAEADNRATAEAQANALQILAEAQRSTAQANEAQAKKLAEISRARELAAQAQALFTGFPQRKMLLALEAINAHTPRLPVTETLLREALTQIGGIPLACQDSITEIGFSPDGHWLASSSSFDKRLCLWNIQNLNDAPLILGDQKAEIMDIDFSEDGRNLTQIEWQRYFPGEPYRKTCPQWSEGQ